MAKKKLRKMMQDVPANEENNPILLVTKFPALSETSIVDQSSTTLNLVNRHLTLINSFQAIGAQFMFIVNVLIYDPVSEFSPIAVIDTANDDFGVSRSRVYHQAYQSGFGRDQNSYQHAMFYLSNILPVEGNIQITVKHPPCKRRIVTVEQFANIAAEPLDQQSTGQSTSPGQSQISTGLTGNTSQPFELVYGSVAIGRDFAQYIEPGGFIPIQNIGTNIDPFDATLKTYYRLSSIQDKFGLSALISNNFEKTNFVWSAAVQTFKAIQL